MADNMGQYRALLDKMRIIHAENAKVQEWRRARGEMFNTFSVLHHWGEEVTVHSRFIAELLNPKGSHGCGAQLLKAFCDTAGIEGFNYEGAKVEAEKAFDYGRMDIVVTQKDNKKVIVIENKIYADDGPLQLQRYKKYCESYGEGNWTLLYLTLDGHEPSGESTGALPSGEKPYWRCISYRDDIAKWLDDCVHTAAVAKKEKVRVGVNEYLDLIKRITGDDMGSEMRDELVDLMTKDNNLLLVAGDLAPLILDAKLKLFDGIKTALKERFALKNEDFRLDYNRDKDCFKQ